MQTVTCFHCGTTVEISPDVTQCSSCGEDLQHLLAPETVADHFLARAHALSERGEYAAALTEAERGLTYAASSDLHLMAAILAQQIGQFDRMRSHVAAIPVDDSLRREAEWLLRAHQDRQAALREAARQTQPAQAQPPTSATPLLDDLLGRAAPARAVRRPQGQAVASVAILATAVLMVVASWWLIGPGALPAHEVASRDGQAGAPTVQSPAVQSSAVQSPTVPTTPPTLAATAPTPLLPTATPQLILLPTATPTPVVAENVVQTPGQPTDAGGVVDANPRRVVVVEAGTFDLQEFLRDAGNPALAELAVTARLQDETLILEGIVHLDLQRRQLLQLLQGVPGVRQVIAVDLLLRPLPTYVVQEGDTLWSIVYNIYGDVERLDEFATLNRDVLPAPDAIAPGIELRVLPIR